MSMSINPLAYLRSLFARPAITVVKSLHQTGDDIPFASEFARMMGVLAAAQRDAEAKSAKQSPAEP